MQAIRIGHGYDVHAFSPGRQLILGGVDVPCDQGLLGHSDADVPVSYTHLELYRIFEGNSENR